MMRVFAYNMKKYRKKMGISQMRLADMIDTTTSYIGGMEICANVPSMGMVEKIAKALEIEPFRLFVDDKARLGDDTPAANDYLENLTTQERQDLTKRIIARISDDVERILQPEAGKAQGD
ncbi:MAG: helix-turn-helix domain-containing protein [Treponema sp.]|nr:helix-turn-helix domain-containing protein [Treponema sp.]